MRHFVKGTLSVPEIDPGIVVGARPGLVEKRGYMTLQQQIERALAAGVLQEKWRREHFPPDVEVPDDFDPPGYSPDEQDIYAEYQLMVDGRARAQARLEQYERKQKEAEKPPVDPEPDPGPEESEVG